MSDLRDAARQALEALEGWKDDAPSQWTTRDEKIITALKTALEQSKPVVVMDAPLLLNGQPLYTHPHRREWRGLTTKEIDAVWEDAQVFNTHYDIARAIEAALKERNA